MLYHQNYRRRASKVSFYFEEGARKEVEIRDVKAVCDQGELHLFW
jgi:hypothetical protein